MFYVYMLVAILNVNTEYMTLGEYSKLSDCQEAAKAINDVKYNFGSSKFIYGSACLPILVDKKQ